MTEREKADIAALRGEGLGYKAIAKQLGLSVNSAKSHCARHPAEKMATAAGGTVCRICGKPVTQTKGKRVKLYCSDACRMKWWNTHTDQVKRKAYYTFICPQCGRQFEGYGNAHRKYCSRQCAADAHRKGGARNGC